MFCFTHKKTPPKTSAEKLKKNRTFRMENPRAPFMLAALLSSLLPLGGNQPLIFLGIGSDRSTGDCLGPLVGSALEEQVSSEMVIMGTLKKPVHALNLEEKVKTIKDRYSSPFILAVDAALGRSENVGQITVGKGPLLPGLAVNKKLPSVGDLHITGTVNVSGCLEFLVLQNTRLFLVMNLAQTITTGIHMALKKDFSYSSGPSSDLSDVP